MNVALPIIDIYASTDSIIKPGYTPVKIRVFEDDELSNNPATCSFFDESSPGDTGTVNYLQAFTSNGVSNINGNCSRLYQYGGTNLGLCRKIKIENMKTYNNEPLKSAYGYYASDREIINNNSLDNYNNYTDCNCENSILRDVKMPKVQDYDNINSREVFVQSNDSYCSTCSSNGKCYISSRHSINVLCINIAELQNNITENASSLTNIQTCDANNILEDSKQNPSDLDPSWAANYAAGVTTTSKGAAPLIYVPQDNTSIYIIVIGILIAIIIIGIIIIKLYKKKTTVDNVDMVEQSPYISTDASVTNV